MADIKLDILWDINEDGDIEVTVSPIGHEDVVLGTATIDEQQIADALSDDLRLFHEGDSDIVFLEWELMAAKFRGYAEQIEDIIDTARQSKADEYSKILKSLAAKKKAGTLI